MTLQIPFPSGPPSVTTFYVGYYGDAVYAETSAAFPFTNPPIPGGSNPPNPSPHKHNDSFVYTWSRQHTCALQYCHSKRQHASTFQHNHSKRQNDLWEPSTRRHLQPGKPDVLDRVDRTPGIGCWRKRSRPRAAETCKSCSNACHGDPSSQRGWVSACIVATRWIWRRTARSTLDGCFSEMISRLTPYKAVGRDGIVTGSFTMPRRPHVFELGSGSSRALCDLDGVTPPTLYDEPGSASRGGQNSEVAVLSVFICNTYFKRNLFLSKALAYSGKAALSGEGA